MSNLSFNLFSFTNVCDIDSVLYAVGGVGASSNSGGGRGGVGGRGRDSVAMGTWRADAQQSGASGAEDSVWYQDSYGTQWS